ncbi:hypothetical protein HPB50_024826 [Hyalomma asiaticum]|uniref:Uncharacterized protein n=1 Tax=Hyalomma asiaticum TaxID=266040 RepID=A0ACB7SI28_HYAAI|nr:hypothetical protein HPB50_024826 [Hyalomma asiaticum]
MTDNDNITRAYLLARRTPPLPHRRSAGGRRQTTSTSCGTGSNTQNKQDQEGSCRGWGQPLRDTTKTNSFGPSARASMHSKGRDRASRQQRTDICDCVIV